MDSRHNEFSLEDLRERQQAIDGLMDSLLNFTPSSTTNTGNQQRRGNTAASNSALTLNSPGPSSQAKRGRGRPPRTAITPSSPATSTANSVISLEKIVECLNQINDQNKKLLNFVEVLADKVETNRSSENTALTQSEGSSTTEQNSVLEGVNNRLEKIEQNLNANTLICRGPTVEKLVTESAAGEFTNLERLKGKICETVCGEEITGIDVSDLQVSLYGRDRKSVRLSCKTPASKITLLKQARRKKPNGLFLNEFLTTSKLKIYRNLRQLKALHPNKIKAVFTRNGNIFYTPNDSSQMINVSSLAELNGIVIPEGPVENPTPSSEVPVENSSPDPETTVGDSTAS